MNGTDEDAVDLARLAAGDDRAAAALLDRLGPRIMGFVLRMTGGDAAAAEDIVQEAFLRLWQKAAAWDAGGAAQVSTWLTRVAANLAIDRQRRAARLTGLDPDFDPPDPAPSALATIVARERAASLDAALTTLPDRQRQAVVLRHVEGYSNPEIAAMMGCRVEAVESLTARGKRRLAQLLEPEDAE